MCGVKIELARDGVGAADPTHLASLAYSLATYSQLTTNTSTSDATSDVSGRDGLSASDLAALVRGVSGLAAARVQFTSTPTTYNEVHVKVVIFDTPCILIVTLYSMLYLNVQSINQATDISQYQLTD